VRPASSESAVAPATPPTTIRVGDANAPAKIGSGDGVTTRGPASALS
jgi:hypothetical protein